MTASPAAAVFARITEHFLADARAALAAGLHDPALDLRPDERELLHGQGDAAVREPAQLKLNRVLLLELHAAARGGDIGPLDSAGALDEFMALATSEGFQQHLQRRYPVLLPRLSRMLEGQCAAVVELAARIGSDRALLTELLDRPAGAGAAAVRRRHADVQAALAAHRCHARWPACRSLRRRRGPGTRAPRG
ncbi:hypothetical protein G6F35_014184 [Rhizopus arrhizus]|nr:hypothetical protein G6F35_014184 [Rhizopus arrhizus]